MAEAFWEYRLKPWDMAAGVLVVEEAGGSVPTLDGRAFSGEGLPAGGGAHLARRAGCSQLDLLAVGVKGEGWLGLAGAAAWTLRPRCPQCRV